MANLEHTFDEYTEQFSARTLTEIRRFAKETELPARVTLEIGSNRGRFLSQLAQKHPDRHHIGVELRFKYVKLARKDHQKLGLANTDILCADVNLVLPVVFDDNQIDEVYILFPDPWWKRNHHKRRLVQPSFLDLLSAKLAPNGNVWIRTDVGPLADAMRDELMHHPNFEPLAPADYPTEPFLRSTRERTVIASGMPVNLVYFVNRKVEASSDGA